MSMVTSGVGRLVHDLELRQTPNSCVCNFTMVYNEKYKDKETAHFLDFVIWDKGAETLEKWAKKGDQLWFSGTPRQETWENEEGKKRSKTVFRIDKFNFIGGRKSSSEETVSNESKGKTDDEPAPF